MRPRDGIVAIAGDVPRAAFTARLGGYRAGMAEEHQHKNPIDAHREGLEQLERAPHHQTTEHDKAPHATAPQPTEPPGEQHRGGPLPYQKR